MHRARVPGPLAPFADGFRAELERRGYTAASKEYKVNEMARLSRWLEAEGLGAADVTSERMLAFLKVFGATRTQPPTLWAMRPLLEWLRAEGVISADPAVPPGPLDELMGDYRRWMVEDRALAERTVGRYEQTARRFLAGRAHADGAGAGVEGLTGEAVTAFLLADVARGLRLGSLQGRVAELRSLLRFLYVAGLTDTALAESVPPVPGWKQTRVPPRMPAADVDALVASCDLSTGVGKRDMAMLLLLARLGLRAAEVIGLELDDLDWRAGELVVPGKGRREERMPLSAEVGEALAAYLTGARPRVETRTVFVTVVAPHRPLAKNTVSQMVWRQCARAGLERVRAHRLRHALASDLLDRGATLPEIGQVLRHRDLATTAVYAKVDHAKLRELALPWPVSR
jgi:site-specific recombinase XerD